MELPVQLKPIPAQVVNERAAYGPLHLKEYIQAPEGSDKPQFAAELKDGSALPTGLICTSDGILTGIPAKDTEGLYEIIVTAKNSAGAITTELVLTIKPSLVSGEIDYINKLKAQIWEAVEHRLPVPEFAELYNRPISMLELSYLWERWGILKIWDAFNLEPAGALNLLQLKDASEHYHVYDRGSCIVAAPKNLFSHERTIEDGLKTARAVAREVYDRGWTIEIVGLEKLSRAAWIEIQRLGELHGKRLEVINFNPTPSDVKLYRTVMQP